MNKTETQGKQLGKKTPLKTWGGGFNFHVASTPDCASCIALTTCWGPLLHA